MGARNEPITYWVLVGDQITRFGSAQRRVAIGYGVQGVIPDGVLVRVSSIDSDNRQAFVLQEKFIGDMLSGIPPNLQPRLLGAL
jgi:EpsI family protein